MILRILLIVLCVIIVLSLIRKAVSQNYDYTLNDVDNNQLLSEEINESGVQTFLNEQGTLSDQFRSIDKNADGILQRSEIISYRDGASLEEVNALYDGYDYSDGNLMNEDEFIRENGNLDNWNVIPSKHCKKKKNEKECKRMQNS
jgi:Ca2+-binding EF-hand superfamily protein